MQVWVILPAYNEEQNLEPLFDGLKDLASRSRGFSVRAVVVDDGSHDATVAVARKAAPPLHLDLLENGTNKGLAVTFMRGMTFAAERAADDDVLVCMDADNSHLPEQIPDMVHRIGVGFDVVIASRYQRGSATRGVPGHRLLLSTGMSILFRLIYPIRNVKDYSCGYRAYRASFFKKALAAQGERLFAKEGFACMVGILLRLDKAGARFEEIPMNLRYDQKLGASKMRVGRTVLRTIGVLIRERLSKD